MSQSQNASIITPDEIQDLCSKYDISKSTLCALLGWGQNTISRYMTGESSPSLGYSNMLKKLFSPVEMQKLLEIHSGNLPDNQSEKLQEKILDILYNTVAEEFNGTVFIKKLNAQELGYRKGVPNKAGSYLLVPKTTLSFFPPLSDSILNDFTTLTVRIAEVNEEVPVTYTYHNSKYASPDPAENRDEYRMYLSHLNIFTPDDIGIFIKTNSTSCYSVYKFTPLDWEYPILNQLISTYKVGKSTSAIVPSYTLVLNRIVLSDLFINESIEPISGPQTQSIWATDEDTETNHIQKEVFIDDLFNEGITTTDFATFATTVKKVKRNERFRKIVLDAYDNKCCITGTSISFHTFNNLQAAHIIPKYLRGSDNPTNGLSLSQDLHWAFDNGLFYIDNDYIIRVHPYLSDNEVLSKYNGQKIHLPLDQCYHPSLEALTFHHDNVYGKFINR